MGVIVQKYGGSSIDGHDRLLTVARRVAALRRAGHDVVVVVSAQGETTDLLLAQARRLTPEPVQRELDMLMTAGERISMSLLAIALNSIGCPAVSFTGSQVGIITDTRHTNARILEVRPHRVIKELERGSVVVVGGFQGVSTEKEVTTLGRGGSDTTAVALAAALGAECCEILTDVDAVYTADPRRVTEARPLREISYGDMAELARFGARVLKEDAIRFAERAGIEIAVGGSSCETPGTIVLEKPRAGEPSVVGLSLLEDVDVEVIEARDRQSGIARPQEPALFTAAARGVLIAALPRGRGNPTGGETTIRASLICAAGPRAGDSENAGRALDALARSGIEAISMWASGRSTILGVAPERGDDALAALHAAFFTGDGARSNTGSPLT